MVQSRRWLVVVLFAGALVGLSIGGNSLAQPPGKGGMGKGKGFGKGKNDPSHQADMEVFHFLLDHREEIRRTIQDVPTGVETVTESDKPEITKKIQEHVVAMHKRVKQGRGIHMRDPLFAELFREYEKIKMTYEKTEKGVKVKEISDDPQVAKLIQAHARVVSKFVQNGYDEVCKNHPLPGDQ